MTNKGKHVSVIYIKATPEQVWQGLTSPEFTRRYFHNTDVKSDWKQGSEVLYLNQDESVAVKGQILEVKYPTLLSYTWHIHYDEESNKEGPSKVTFSLEQVNDATKLTLIHDDFPEGSVVLPRISEGWVAILCNLKTLMETRDVMSIS